MPRTDPDPLGDGFKWRLRAELNRVRPRHSAPRYLSPARHGIGAWRFAPAGLAAGVAGMIVLTAYATTGSPNPVVWTKQIVTKIQPDVAPESSPAPSREPSHHEDRPAPAPPTHAAQPTERPEPTETPEPSDGDHSGDSGRTGEPSPSPGDD
jgi:hypothetical protein